MARPSIHQIAAVFLRHGSWTFGGGSSTIAVLQTELLDGSRWVPAAILGGYLSSEFGSKRLQPIALRRLLALALVIAAVKMILPC